MANLTALNSKEAKAILRIIKEQWNAEPKLDYFFFKDNDNKIYIMNREFTLIDTSKLRINSLGLYIGQLRDNEFRLSIEGSQIIGKHAKKNVVELNKEDMRRWLRGEEIDLIKKIPGFIILKHNNDFLGSGKITKDNKLMNFIPKERRIRSAD